MPIGPIPELFQRASTLSQQASQASQGISSQFNSVTNGIRTAVSDFTSKLTNGGVPTFSALDTSINNVKSLSPRSLFTDNDTNKNFLSDFTPEQSRINGKRDLAPLQFPLDIPGNKFIKFTFSSYYQSGPLFKRETIPQRTIILPIPADLVERYGVTYQEKQLGVLGVLQETGSLNKAAEGLQNLTEEGARDVGRNLGNLAKDTGNAAAVARNVIGAISDSAGTAIDRATGTILNPYSALQFMGIELRSHSFKYKFSPNSLAESRILKEIVRELKIRMLPEKRGLVYNFPDVCTIEFGNGDKSLYFFKNCYLKSINVNYAPSGTPAFFLQAGGGEYPAEVELSMDFGEIEPVTRNDVITGNFTGKVGQALQSTDKNVAQS